MNRQLIFSATLYAIAFCAVGNAQDQLQVSLGRINEVGNRGLGHSVAIEAWKSVAKADSRELPVLLKAIDDSKPLAANWIRAAVDQIAERRIENGGSLPNKELEQVIFDQAYSPRARRLAYEWLLKVDSSVRDRVIPKMLNDSSAEMRRDAVAMVIAKAESAAGKEGSVKQYKVALTAARDIDQIESVFDKLVELGEEIDLPKHFGFVTTWKTIGPFDNTNKGGFDVAYPPEEEIRPDKKYVGKKGEVAWIDHSTDDNYGMVNLNEVLGKNMGAAGYAVTTFKSSEAREVDLRVGCICAVKLWLNGELLMSNEVYHSGTKIDQYIAQGKLKAGENQILLKVCQNEQTESWAQDWEFQFRVCDELGTAILSK